MSKHYFQHTPTGYCIEKEGYWRRRPKKRGVLIEKTPFHAGKAKQCFRDQLEQVSNAKACLKQLKREGIEDFLFSLKIFNSCLSANHDVTSIAIFYSKKQGIEIKGRFCADEKQAPIAKALETGNIWYGRLYAAQTLKDNNETEWRILVRWDSAGLEPCEKVGKCSFKKSKC